ncbi:hypothetical protein [Photobacterium sp. BZF1]|uniref:hypothetical protein n=1 Tax=Photobacterium sp. BZF1 TaxID=1904457 RepID=UPI001CA3F0D1|nr:hypothetical protein [Photobacterium sp. BZF1]
MSPRLSTDHKAMFAGGKNTLLIEDIVRPDKPVVHFDDNGAHRVTFDTSGLLKELPKVQEHCHWS